MSVTLVISIKSLQKIEIYITDRDFVEIHRRNSQTFCKTFYTFGSNFVHFYTLKNSK